MKIKDDTCFVRHIANSDEEFVFLTHYREVWENGYCLDDYIVDTEYIYYEYAGHHGFDPDKIYAGTYIMKEQYLKWTKQIQHAKETAVKMLQQAATPISRDIEAGDFILCLWNFNKEDESDLCDNEYIGLRVVEIQGSRIYAQRVYIGICGLDSCDDLDWEYESLDCIQSRSCFITAEVFMASHDYMRNFCIHLLEEIKSHAKITEHI